MTSLARLAAGRSSWSASPPAASATGSSATGSAPRAAIAVLGGFEQLQDAQRNETILRLNWTRQNLAGFSFEAGIEGALNTLDHQVQLFEFLPGGDRVQIDLPIDEAEVKEKRAEAFIRRRPAALARAPPRWWHQLRIFEHQRSRRHQPRPGAAQILEAQPDARLEGRQWLAWPDVGSPYGRPARFLRFHQLGGAIRRSGQCRQSGPGAPADLGVPRHDRTAAPRRRTRQARCRL